MFIWGQWVDNSLLLFLRLVVEKSAQFRVDPNDELINSVLSMHWALWWGEEERRKEVDCAFIGLWDCIASYHSIKVSPLGLMMREVVDWHVSWFPLLFYISQIIKVLYWWWEAGEGSRNGFSLVFVCLLPNRMMTLNLRECRKALHYNGLSVKQWASLKGYNTNQKTQLVMYLATSLGPLSKPGVAGLWLPWLCPCPA